jgi:phosphoglucosamine mutase
MKTALFGTDGIRGKVNKEPMVPPMILRLGQAIAKVLTKKKKRPKIIIGKDTRVSGYIFEYALTSGLCSMGVDVYQVGPMPTPAVAHLVKSFAADAGIMISASHNPVGDNGIKFFGADGYKLSDEEQKKINEIFDANNFNESYVPVQKLGKAFKIEDARGRYIEFVKQSIKNRSLKGYKIVLDCANGAAYKVAPWILQELGADVIILNNTPDGLNINKNCGSEHPEAIQAAVKKHKADIGIALDGDADRVIMVDEAGNIVDGDHLLAIAAIHFKKKGKLTKDTVVTTVMANAGFDEAMKKEGIKVIRTSVGDRYLTKEMQEHGYTLSAEQSGHMIFGKHATTGDGTLSALQILGIMVQKKKKLSELATCMSTYPQILLNVEVKEKTPIEKTTLTKQAVKEAEEALHGAGRVLVRYSGTQPLCRVMVEGKDKKQITSLANAIKKAVQAEVGV